LDSELNVVSSFSTDTQDASGTRASCLSTNELGGASLPDSDFLAIDPPAIVFEIECLRETSVLGVIKCPLILEDQLEGPPEARRKPPELSSGVLGGASGEVPVVVARTAICEAKGPAIVSTPAARAILKSIEASIDREESKDSLDSNLRAEDPVAEGVFGGPRSSAEGLSAPPPIDSTEVPNRIPLEQ